MMNRSTVLAAVAGAAVTVVVYEGTAVVRAAEGAPVEVAAGDHYRVVGTAPAAAAPETAPVAPEDRAAHLAKLQADLEAAKQALAEANFEGALTRGQLEAMQGKPSEWPANAPEALTPEKFREGLEARLASMPDVKIAEVDCGEYPCVAAIEYTGADPTDDWNEGIGAAVKGWFDDLNLDKVSLNMNTSRFRDDQGHQSRYVIFGGAPGGDGDVNTRTDYRINGMVDELGQQLGGGDH